MFHKSVVHIHSTIPHTVGIAEAKKAHFHPPDSFFIVSNVVLHGKCNKVNIITLIPVSKVQPFCLNISPIAKISSKSTKLPWPI